MCGKYFILFCLLLTTLLAAQEVSHSRINVRLFPTQILSVTTAKELSDKNQNIKKKNKNELTASNLYGYQIKVMKEQQNETTGNNFENKSYFSESKLIYSTTSSTTDHKITTAFLANNDTIHDKRNINNINNTVIYLIITQ